MKNLIVTFCLILFTSILFAQNVKVSIVGLDEKDSKAEVVFEVESAELINSYDSRTNQVNDQTIIIKREYDATSELIKNAVDTGKIFISASVSSQNLKVNLGTLVLRDYSWKLEEGEAVTEFFEISFRSIY